MQRLVWLTDIHLNFAPPAAIQRLLDDVLQQDAEGVLITGDIAESHDLAGYLRQMETHLDLPIYFVLGNHDFYRSSVARVRQQVRRLCRTQEHLVWLQDVEAVPLSPRTALVGCDGWGDAREGDFAASTVMLNDYLLIEDLADLDAAARAARLNRLGDEAADHLRRVVPPALETFDHLLVATHVPPLRAACWYQGRPSDDNWAPHFVCQAAGRALVELAANYPDRLLTVLCGHTHGGGEAQPLPNLRLLTGPAEYCRPQIQQVLEIA